MRKLNWALLSVVVVCFARPCIPAGQLPIGPQPRSNWDSGNLDPALAHRQLLLMNAERQKQIISDAEKLLALARQLNTEAASANTESLTPEELQQWAEIEKLAKSVKSKMTLTLGGGGMPPPMPMVP